jgi:hypothetical protein
MIDTPIVYAFPLDGKTLYVDECPWCGHSHYHLAKRSPYRDIRQANCQQRHLKKKLRDKPLFYRLQVMHTPADGSAQVIAFPKSRAR